MAAINDLARIVTINEEIKAVVVRAHRINLLALNAILLSRRAGGVAVGFGVISQELRGFSRNLMQNMQALMNLSFDSIQIVSKHQRYARINDLIHQATELAQYANVTERFALAEERFRQLRLAFSDTYRKLESLVLDADEAARFGDVISRSLKIEAAYGGPYRTLLGEIAKQFSEFINDIPVLLKALSQQVQGWA